MAEESLDDKAAFQLQDLESGKFTPQQGWLKEIGGRWPGGRPIEELLGALNN